MYVNVPVIKGLNIENDPFVFVASCGSEAGEIVMDDLVELGVHRPFAGESSHPDAVGYDEMVEGAMEGAEESTAVLAIIGIGSLGCGLVEPLVGPAIVLGEHREVVFHRSSRTGLVRPKYRHREGVRKRKLLCHEERAHL